MATEYVPNWLMKRAFLTPDRLAVITEEEMVTFHELWELVQERTSQLHEIGVRQGDHCAVLMNNSLQSVILIHALQSIGAVAVMLNTRLTASECAYQIKDSEAKFLFYNDEYEKKNGEIVAITPELTSVSINVLCRMTVNEGVNVLPEFCLDELHTIIYTSGTTGRPKGVMLSNGNHWWSAVGSALNLGVNEDDRWLSCLPLFHVSGLSVLMKSVIYGMTVILHPTFSADKVHTALMKDNVTHISVVSVMLQELLEKLAEARYPDTLRVVLLGGGPAPLHLLEQSKQKHIPVYQTYGMTETASQIATLSPDALLSKTGSAGKPLFPAQLTIDDNGKKALPNVIGEIVVKGPNVTTGYYNLPDKTAATLKKGWLYTGDVGKLDEDGYLYVIDRRSDLIISGGENIYPAEIEEILLKHPAVKEAGVLGLPHLKWGVTPAAAIVAGAPVTTEELQLHCQQYLAKYKVPNRYYFVDELPRTAAKKLQRHRLAEVIKQHGGC